MPSVSRRSFASWTCVRVSGDGAVPLGDDGLHQHLHLVLLANGSVAGTIAAVIGTAIAMASWITVAPALETATGLRLIGEHDQIDVRSQACSAVGVAVLTTAPSSAATSTRPPGLAIHNVHAASCVGPAAEVARQTVLSRRGVLVGPGSLRSPVVGFGSPADDVKGIVMSNDVVVIWLTCARISARSTDHAGETSYQTAAVPV